MLDETEWERVHALYLEDRSGRRAVAEYEAITGFEETNPLALFHHRVALYGPPCHAGKRPLRTLQARLCGSCMAPRATS